MSEKKINIFVNATAASQSGALVVLQQFYEAIKDYGNKQYQYYIFCSVDLTNEKIKHIKIINNIKAKKIHHRIYWELWGLKQWSRKHKIMANVVISLQNTGFHYFSSVKKVVYQHQSLAFEKGVRWSLFDPYQRKSWFYNHIYFRLIKYTVKKDFYVITQTECMKKNVHKQLNIKNNRIMVFKPAVRKINIRKIRKILAPKNRFLMFYPATAEYFKNHIIIIKALSKIKEKHPDIINNLLIYFTIDKNTGYGVFLNEQVKKFGLTGVIKFKGYLSYNKVLSLYKSADLLLFPSFVESSPLPLVEAVQFGIPILTAKKDYAHESLRQYKNAGFIQHNDVQAWVGSILKAYKNRKKNLDRSRNQYIPHSKKDTWKRLIEFLEDIKS